MSAIGVAPPKVRTHRHPDLVIVTLGALLAIVLTVALLTALSAGGNLRVAGGQTATGHPARAGAAGLALPSTVRYSPQEKSLSTQVAVATTGGVYSRQDKSFTPAR